MYKSSRYKHGCVCKNVLILDSFFPLPQFAYSYWVVFSLNIQIDQQSKQVFCKLFCKDEVSTPFGVCVCLCKQT